MSVYILTVASEIWLICFREFRETSRDVCFSSDLTVNMRSMRPEGRAPKSIHITVAQQRGRCQSTLNTFTERSVYGFACVSLVNKNYSKRNRGTSVRKKFISDD